MRLVRVVLTVLITTALVLSPLAGAGVFAPKPVAASVDQDFYGWNLDARTPSYPDWPGDWVKGNLGKNYREWDWVSYVLVLNGYGGAPLPEMDIAFDFYAANAIFVDLVRNFYVEVREPYPGSGQPNDVTPGNFDSTWGGTPFTPTVINKPYPVGTTDNEVSPPGKAYWKLTPNSHSDLSGSVPPGKSVVIYFEARLAPSFIWQAGKGYVLASTSPTWGGDRYGAGNPDTDEWDTPHNGAGYTSGSSRHFYLESEGVGQKKVPIPIAELPGAEIHGSKFHDLNNNGIWDTATEPGLEGWTINMILTVEGIDYSVSTTTASDGSYSFTALPAGDYTISEVLLTPDWMQTAPTPVPPGVHSGTLAEGEILNDNNFGNFYPEPDVLVTKVADTDITKEGDTVHFTITVDNTGNVDLNLVSFEDTLMGDISANFSGTLLAGDDESWGYDYVVLGTEGDPLSNTAEAHYDITGLPNDITDSDTVEVDVVNPGLTVTKEADGSP